MQITLSQFEQIDGLFNACLRRPALEQVMGHPLASRDYVNSVYFRPEWQLEDALVDTCGLTFVQDQPSVVDCAAHILTAGLLGTIEVVDAEALA
jgi:hypothetical protein